MKSLDTKNMSTDRDDPKETADAHEDQNPDISDLLKRYRKGTEYVW